MWDHSLNKQDMKRFLHILLIFALMFSACDNIYINGYLHGMWNLQKVEDCEKGNLEYPQDIYYSFQHYLTFISKHNETEFPLRYLGNLYYDKVENTININGLRNFPNEKYVATLNDLEQFMIFDTNTTFNILTLDNEQLILEYNSYRYYLIRW